MSALQQLIVVAGSTVAGGLAGGLVALWRTGSSRPTVIVRPPAPKTSSGEWIEEAAAGWATDNGCLDAQGLVADKLRLVVTLQERIARRRRP
jgi:hypothetical protein